MFDPNEILDERNAIYRRIHEEYKHLVDFMLGSFMEEMQITPEQFEVACLAGKHGTSGISFHHGLFQQVCHISTSIQVLCDRVKRHRFRVYF